MGSSVTLYCCIMCIMSINNCFICDTPGAESCEWCGSVNSCPEHFTVHRNNNVRLPFTIRYCETMGHYMVATRDIKQMELILREEPVMVGPYLRPDQPHCVQCFKLVKGVASQCAETSAAVVSITVWSAECSLREAGDT